MPEQSSPWWRQSGKVPRVLYVSLALWSVVVFSIYISSYLVRAGLYFNGVPPVPLRTNPLLLVIGVLLLPFCAALSMYLIVRWRKFNIAIAVCGLGTILVCVGAIFGSLYPGPGTVVARDQLRAADQPLPQNVFAIPVFFENGKEDILPEERRRLIDQFSVYSGCGKGSIFVRGFASSRPYRDYSSPKGGPIRTKDWRNTDLANRRAQSVQRFLKDEAKVDSQLADPWPTYEVMVGARRLKDVDLSGKLIPSIERFNRRVEVYWQTNLCLGVAP